MTDIVLHFRSARTESINVEKGRNVTVAADGIVGGRAFETRADGSGAQRLASTVGIMFRFRQAGTAIYDRFVVDRASVSIDNKNELITGSREFVAKYNYDLMELCPFVEHGPVSSGYANYASDLLYIENTAANCVISDFVSDTNRAITVPTTITLSFVTNLTHAVYSQSDIELFWNTPADISNITGYEIRRDGVLVGTVGNSQGSFLDTGLTAGTTYTYGVRSVNGTGGQSLEITETLTTNT